MNWRLDGETAGTEGTAGWIPTHVASLRGVEMI